MKPIQSNFQDAYIAAIAKLSFSSPLAYNVLKRIKVNTRPVLEIGSGDNKREVLGYATIGRSGLPEIFLSEKTEKYGHKMVAFVLHHEIWHLILNHCKRLTVNKSPSEHMVDNIMMDLVINHSIMGDDDNLYNELRQLKRKFDQETAQLALEIKNPSITDERRAEIDKEYADITERYTEKNMFFPFMWLVYHEDKLSKHGITRQDWSNLDHVFLKGILAERVQSDMFSDGNPDGHFVGSGERGDVMTDAKFENILQQAKSECDSRGQSYCQSGVGRTLLAKLLKSKVDYRSILQNFATSTRNVETERRWKRRHRRYPTQSPGIITKRQPHVVVVADTSGSMADQETIDNLNSQIAALHAVCKTVTVVVGDTEERGRFDLSKTRFRHDTVNFVGGGGTDLQFGLDAAKELGADGVVVQTDGYIPDIDNYGIPTFFCIFPGGRAYKPEQFKNLMVGDCI